MVVQPRARSYGSTAIYMKRLDYEPTLRLMRDLIDKGDNIFDIGANFGIYSIVLAAKAGITGQVWAFEPGKEALSQLRTNVTRNPDLNIIVCPFGLSDRAGDRSLFHAGGPMTFTMGGPADDVNMSAEQVHVQTLDQWFTNNEGSRLDAIKMDVEGHELKVLRGATAVIERFHPKMLFEVSRSALERNGTSPSQLCEDVLRRGYSLYTLDSDQLVPAKSEFPDGNYLALAGDDQPGAVGHNE